MIRRVTVLAILLVGIFSINGICQLNWSPAGLEGGVIKSLYVRTDGVVYAGTQRGVYISVDFGSSWFRGATNLDQYGINAVIVVGTMVFAAGDNGGFYVSYDNGYNFSVLNSGYNINTLCKVDQTIYAGLGGSVNNSGILVSTNYGVNWSQTNMPGNIIVNDIITDDVALYAATSNGVYLAYHIGTSWTKYDNGIPADTKVFSLKKAGFILLAATDKGIYRSTDNGSTWNTANNGLTPGLPFLAVTVQGSIAYTCQFGKGVYKASNYGDSWVPIQNGLYDNMIYRFGVYNSYLYAGSAGGGMYLTIDNGATWFAKNTGLEAHTVNAMHNIGNIMYIGTQGGGVFRSLNLGANWIPLINQPENTVIYCFAEGGGYLFTGTYGGVFRSVPGSQWLPVNTGLADSIVFALNYNGSYLFAGTQKGGIYRSSNLGTQWTKLSGIILNDTVFALTNIGNDVYASTRRNGFVKSTDNGDTWQTINTGFSNLPYSLSLTSRSNDLYSGVFYGSPHTGVHKSSNQGNSWYWITNPLDEACYYVHTYLNNIFASFYNYSGGIVRLSTNDGANWSAVTPIPSSWGQNSDVKCLRVFENNLYAGTTRKSLWKIPLSQIVSAGSISESVPESFKLKQNYPNPFNPVTVIPYEISEPALVTIKVYNVLGMEVKELVNERREPGFYETRLDASNLSTGLYFCRMTAQGNSKEFIQTKKMVLIR